MRNLLIGLFFFTTIISATAQCGFGGINSGVTVSPTASSQFTSNIQAGRYFTMNVANGGNYTISTCGLTSWDTQLTIYSTTGTYIAYNDDASGCGYRSRISFNTNFTGQVRVILNQYSCASSSNTTQVGYFGTAPTPFISVTTVTVGENAGYVDFTVTHSGASTSGPFTLSYTTMNGSAVAGTDNRTTSGTLNFNGTSSDTETVTIPILDDLIMEGPEDFTLEFISTSDSSVTISASGICTINDNELMSITPLALVREFNGNFDFTSTGGSLRTLPNSNSNPNDACQIQTSSQAPLLADIPLGASIERAYLYWAHSSTTLDNNVTFEGQNVTADVAYTTSLTTGQFYGFGWEYGQHQ